LNKKNSAPWKPKIKDVFDASYFDKYPDSTEQNKDISSNQKYLFIDF
jgi:hypothetical protein